MSILILDRVKQTSTFTGTTKILMDNAVAAPQGFQKFRTAMATGYSVHYAIENGAEWEVGTGYLTIDDVVLGSNYDSITRSPIASSNANALVNFSAGTKNIIATISAKNFGMATVRHNFALGGDPYTGTDNSGGYGIGSIVKGASDFWICLDANAGAAIWRPISAPSPMQVKRDFLTTSGLGATIDTVALAYEDVRAFDILVSARSDADVCAAWKITGAVKTAATNAAFVGTPVVALLGGDTGTSGWAASVDVSGTTMRVRAAGQAGTNIYWSSCTRMDRTS